jgi:hypothetical protein
MTRDTSTEQEEATLVKFVAVGLAQLVVVLLRLRRGRGDHPADGAILLLTIFAPVLPVPYPLPACGGAVRRRHRPPWR